jgi:predicted nucleotidyltransferase/HEPN domain-containing protein
MQTSLNHLLPLKQNELKKITSTIRQNSSDVEKVILFGSYARGDYKELKDLKPDRKSGHVSDYDILVVTSKKETALDSLLWRKIADELKKFNFTASPKILTHDIEALNIKLAESQYFYSEIKKDGISLYDSNKFTFDEPRELTDKEQQRIAQDHFDEWFLSAKEFFFHYEIAFKNNSLKKAAFFLHQSAESAYKTVLLVFSNHSPNEHFLQFLGEEAELYSKLMKNIFAKISKEDEDRFRLFEYAYIGGRYDRNYRISEEDLKILAENVTKLLEITKEVCEVKIRSFV